MVEPAEYEAMRQRPAGTVVMYQRWRSLLFLHFPADPAEIQRLLPEGLTVDTYPDSEGNEKAWIGLVPFRMEGVTPRGVPELRGIHAFPETNVRTYVHRNGHDPGVWFFSLDAGNPLACRVARRFFHLPYHEAQMSVKERADTVNYQSTRRKDGRVCDVVCEIGEALPLPKPGSLEFFLIERYLLYSCRGKDLFTGRVFHHPYALRSVNVESLRESLVEAAGVGAKPFEHRLFSPGVDVEVFGLNRAR